MTAVLEGIRVLDFRALHRRTLLRRTARAFSVPTSFASKTGGSEDRYTTPVTDDGQGALFFQMNCNSAAVTLNSTERRKAATV